MRHGPGGGIADGVEICAPVVRDHALGIARGAAGVAHGNRVPFVSRSVESGQRVVAGQPGLVVMGANALARTIEFAVADVDDQQRSAVLLAQYLQRLCDHG